MVLKSIHMHLCFEFGGNDVFQPATDFVFIPQDEQTTDSLSSDEAVNPDTLQVHSPSEYNANSFGIQHKAAADIVLVIVESLQVSEIG